MQEVEDLGYINQFRESKVEGIDCFEGGEAGLEDSGFDKPLLPSGGFLGGQEEKDIGGGEFFPFGFDQSITTG
jgi:hypothetical protein